MLMYSAGKDFLGLILPYMTNTAYQTVISRFNQSRVLVIGDIILDVYLKGDSSRLSPEAPVPVVNVLRKEMAAGGAANIALNLRALDAEVSFFLPLAVM